MITFHEIILKCLMEIKTYFIETIFIVILFGCFTKKMMLENVLCIFHLPIYTYLHVIFIPQKSCMLSWFCKFPQFCHVKFLTNKETVQRSNRPSHTTQPIPAACCSLLRAACCGLPCPGIIALHGWISCLLIFSTVVAAQGSERCCICTSFHL